MTLEGIYYIGQTIAVVAILISIIFVGLQVRQNTKALKTTSHHAVTDSFNHLNGLIAGDTRVSRIYRMGLSQPEKLDEDEYFSYTSLLLAYMRIFETLYFQNKNATMDPLLYESELRSLRFLCSAPSYREWWAMNTISFSDEFRAFVSGMMETATLEPDEYYSIYLAKTLSGA